MSETTFRERQPKWHRTFVAAGAIVVAGASILSAAKSVVIIPEQILRHDAELKALREVDLTTARELREQRDLLLEMRTDLKYIKRNNYKPE